MPTDRFEALYGQATTAFDEGSFSDARLLWIQAAGEVSADNPEERPLYADALHGEAQAIYWGDLPEKLNGLNQVCAALDIYGESLQPDVQVQVSPRETALTEGMMAATLVGRIVSRRVLRLEKKHGGTMVGATNKELEIARRFFGRASLYEAELGSKYTHVVGRRDPKVVELAACTALGKALDPARDRKAIAKEAKVARSAAKECKDPAGKASRVALAATVVNRLMTPGRSWRRSLAVHIATLPGVF